MLDLLLITKGKKKHYCLIKDFNRFVYGQILYKGRKDFCWYCLQCFKREDAKRTYSELYSDQQGAGNRNVKKGEDRNTLMFKNYHKQLNAPFVIYADFEAITGKIHTVNPSDEKSYTDAYQKHEGCGYGCKVVCSYDDKYSKPVEVYRGENAVHKFIKMLQEAEDCKGIRKKHFNKDFLMKKDVEELKKATKCHICGKEYVGWKDGGDNIVKIIFT